MSHVDFIIVGQGISGSFAGWYLQKAGRSFITIDQADPFTSSRVAAGIINPVTGRRIVQTWMIDTLLNFALNAYAEWGTSLGITAISRKDTVDFFPSPQMLLAFMKRLEDDPAYLSLPEKKDLYDPYFRYDFGFGDIAPCYAVNLSGLLPAWRKKLSDSSHLLEDRFDETQLVLTPDGVHYQDISASMIIFCEGAAAQANKWFNKLPFAYNKGQALLIRQDELPANRIFKKGIHIAPQEQGIFWVGSSYEWDFADAQPTAVFRDKTSALLRHWLKSPFEILDHLAAVRPATVERRPFAGIHPHHPQLAILNGMGTKGCSLAPYFAHQLVERLIHRTAILPEADISRFSKTLIR